MQTMTFPIDYLQDKILIITEDIINCYKKGMCLVRSELHTGYYIMDGWVSVIAESIDKNSINVTFWQDEEVLPFVPKEKVKMLTKEELQKLKKIETDDGYMTIIEGLEDA